MPWSRTFRVWRRPAVQPTLDSARPHPQAIRSAQQTVFCESYICTPHDPPWPSNFRKLLVALDGQIEDPALASAIALGSLTRRRITR